jgi:hypothetical protein
MKKTLPDIVAVFDIGNGVVSGALVEMIPRQKPVILTAFSEEINVTPKSAFGEFFGETNKAIEKVGALLLNTKIGAPVKTYCFLSTPWYAGQTRVVKMSKSVPFVFTKKIWHDLSKKEVARFVEETVSQDADAIVIENKNMSVVLDGVESTDPLEKKVKDVEISIFLSVSSNNIINSFKHAIEHSFSTVPIVFNSFVFSSFITIRDVFCGEATNSLIIDVGSLVTEIGCITGDVLTSIVSFPKGTRGIMTSIRETFAISNREAKSLFHLYLTDRLETSKHKKIQSIVSREVKEWYTEYEKAIKTFVKNKTIPTKGFITVDEEFAQVFSFKEKLLANEAPLLVQMIHGATFSLYVKPEHVTYRNPFIMLESFFINRIH